MTDPAEAARRFAGGERARLLARWYAARIREAHAAGVATEIWIEATPVGAPS